MVEGGVGVVIVEVRRVVRGWVVGGMRVVVVVVVLRFLRVVRAGRKSGWSIEWREVEWRGVVWLGGLEA